VVFLYRVGMDTSRWWDLSICDVVYAIGGRGGGWSVTCAILGVALVFSLFSWAGLRFLHSFLLSTAGGLMCCVCSLSFVSVVWWSLCPVHCGFVYLSSIQGVSYLADRCSGAWPVWWLLHGTVMVKSLGIVVSLLVYIFVVWCHLYSPVSVSYLCWFVVQLLWGTTALVSTIG